MLTHLTVSKYSATVNSGRKSNLDIICISSMIANDCVVERIKINLAVEQEQRAEANMKGNGK